MAQNTPNATDLACSLTDAEMKTRRALMRKKLLPHVRDWQLRERTLTLAFADKRVARKEVEHFVELEEQCCGFLTFTISPPETPLLLKVKGPEGSESVLQLFAEAAAEH